MRWTDRLAGLVSTVILARLLAPADFGIVTMAMIVVGMVDVLLELGVRAALIQNQSADRHDFDTAWTMRLCQVAGGALLVAAAAPIAADYYNDSRVTPVMWVLAFSMFVGGLENIGIVTFQKDMAFGRDFMFAFLRRMVGTILTITLAFLLRSYWALVVGMLLGRLTGVALSYWMHPFRPRPTLVRAKHIWSFSQWNIVMNVASYLSTRLDKVLLGRRTTPSMLGAYSMADDIASMPASELLAPLGRVMLPAFSAARGDRAQFKRIVMLAFAVQALIGLPAGLGVALVAREAVPLLLGHQWNAAIPIVQVLGLAGALTSLTHASGYMLLAMGRVRSVAAAFLIQFLALIALLVAIFPTGGPQVVAASRLGVAAFGVILSLSLARVALPEMRFRDLLLHAWRPTAACGAMAIAVIAASSLLADKSLLIALAAKVGVGVFVYVVTISALWASARFPDGSEAYVSRLIQSQTSGGRPSKSAPNDRP